MNEFDQRYTSLNDAQKKAVDTIDGPLMVVAGPGTGKTELLSMRVANILKKTDALPQNILCLTFTESGATAMRERLAALLGPEAYKVAVHTFHSFGSEIINYYGEYFYQGAHFRPADQLSSYETLAPLLEALPHKNPLSSKMNGAFTHLRDIQSTISDLKKSGLTPDEVERILDHNDAFLDSTKEEVSSVFSERLSKKQFESIRELLSSIRDYDDEELNLISYIPLNKSIGDTLGHALALSEADNSTKPLSAWKRAYLEKNERGGIQLKDIKRALKLRAAVKIYYDYLISMQERSLYDFDDMILRVVHAMEVFADLRLNLQEQYQYILVDEFQDTNDAQMRLLWNLTNNPSQNGRPNVMVVGDDDQAIYRFQGAKLSNILDYKKRYDDVLTITLQENYRSDESILSLSRSVIVQGQERLEHTDASIDKTLRANHNSSVSTLTCNSYASESEQYSSVAQLMVKNMIDRPDASRAVIARNHRQLIAILPHLQHHDIPLRYERQEDVLESEPVAQLELLARIIWLLSDQAFSAADEYLPQLLAHPAWHIPATEMWQISLTAHRSRQFWLETMLETPGRLKDIAEWIIVSSHLAQNETLEFMLDHLFGVVEPQVADTPSDEANVPFIDGPHEDFVSPLRAYFFPHDSLETHPGRFMAHLASLQRLRQTVREYRPDTPLKLADFIGCIDLHRELGLPIQGSGEVYGDDHAVQLLTAHRSKGLEFDEVYIIDAVDSIWGEGARTKGRLIQFPSNMPLSPAGDNSDERLRLFYVALTRARDQLYISYAKENSSKR
ncbi:MAG TPA: ATP-dependent helicase, partial [Candidatus Nitrosotenuis sp.]|nr:ATP-dependent helicase [Candidatus Nitrosotenuis sp.]